jgi:adenylate kinase family enzyme
VRSDTRHRNQFSRGIVPTMRRVSVVGNSGAGKTTLARALAARLGVPHVELDAIFHQRDWRPLPKDEFQARVGALIAGDGWVVDGNYGTVRELVWARADTVVWVDPPRRTAIRQLLVRTFGRWALRAELWNGNRERLREFFSRDPDRSLLRWAWGRHRIYRERYRAAQHDPRWAHLRFVRVGSRADARRLLRAAEAVDPDRHRS